ncbi:MAG: hypothetical protein HKP42_07995 [Maribacter sp.]|nr:hypothetical protein [Maribacter sp.]
MPTKLLKRLLLTLFLTTTPIFSQEGFVTGQLIDKKNGEPIVYATIRVKDKAIGVISNLDGSFRIPEKFKDFGSILEISSMGYVSKDILVYDLSKYKTNIIRLIPAIELLDEVVVEGVRKVRKRSTADKRMSASRIVARAIKNISLNYPTSPFAAIGYYRDFQMNKNKYFNLNEALFEVWDQGFGALDYETTKIRIYEHKRNLDFPFDSVSEKPYDYRSRNKTIPGAYLDNYGGNEFTILRIHDALRNNAIAAYDYVNVFKNDFLKNHFFKKEDEVLLNNKKLYKISFIKNRGLVRIKGNLIISKENFAIHKLEYAMYSNYNRNIRKIERTKNRRQKEILFEIIVGYTPIDGLMYPNYLSMKNAFKIKEPPKFIVNLVEYSLASKRFIISFNNIANEKDAVRKSNFKLKFKGKRVNIDKLVHIDDQVILYPNSKISKSLFGEISQALRNDNEVTDFLSVKIKDIKDINGNYVNEPFYREVRQYREFFVQRILTELGAAPNDSLYMNKNAPIFKNQPISRSLDFSDYWMNTPLPNIEE